MTPFDQHGFDVRLEWGPAGVGALSGCAALVVVDVLSFSTAVDVAVSRGARVAPSVGPVGPRSHDRPSLSPVSMRSMAAGERVELPSPNGSRLSVAAADTGAVVVAGCLRSAAAVAAWVARAAPVGVVAAGERWGDGSLRPSVEDLMGAGAIVAGLVARGLAASPEAQVAASVFAAFADDPLAALLDCASGRELVGRGFGDDVRLAAEVDVSTSVPVLRDGAYVDGRRGASA